MSRNWKIAAVCFALILFVFPNVFADNKYEPLLLVRGVRPMGLGNAFEAIADDENAFHYNPAGLAQREEMLFHLLIARPRISSDLADENPDEVRELFEAIDTLMDYDDPLENQDAAAREAREILADRIEEALAESLAARVDLPSIGFAVPLRIAEKYRLTVGSSLYTQSSGLLRVEPRGLIWADPVKDMLDNPIIYNILTQWTFELAAAVEIPVRIPVMSPTNKTPSLSKIYLGTALRWINRSVFTDEDNPFAAEDILSPDGPDGIEGTDDDFTKRYFDIDQDIESVGDFLALVDDNTEKRKGYSFDLGTIFAPVDGLKFAFVMRNLVSNISTEAGDRHFPRNVVVSTAVKPLVLLEQSLKPPSFLDLTLAASLDRRNGDDRLSDFSMGKYTDRIHLGAEVTLFSDGPVSFSGRIGNNQGFLTFGTGLKLGPIHLDFVRYGDLETDWYAGYVNFNIPL